MRYPYLEVKVERREDGFTTNPAIRALKLLEVSYGGGMAGEDHGRAVMQQYDLFIAGGGVGGSVAAKFAARGGLKTLLVEKCKTPRGKPCSGIQFGYLEKIIGEKIPRDRLCRHQIRLIRMCFHDGTSFYGTFPMLNYMRKTFDHWLNQVAQDNGAEFRDECEFLDFEEDGEGVTVTVRQRGGGPEKLRARYAIDATGLDSQPMRRKLRPGDFSGNASTGGGINYYIEGKARLLPFALYQFWNLEYSDAMFAWIYNKTLDDGKDYWVAGTAALSGDVRARQDAFYGYVRDRFGLKGDIVEKEEYFISMDMKSKDRVWLGQGRVLMVGDSAGLMDGVRGVGQDAAALSGRFAAQAVLQADRAGTRALDEYSRLAAMITEQTRRNQEREIDQFKSNDELKAYIKGNLVSTGVKMAAQSVLNRFRPPERIRLLPP
jgi:flavin-dependent dehydrogenase